jgi:serine/threonine protein kinase
MFQGSSPARIGRYDIKSLLGAGGMGTLYLARDTNPTTPRLVALKLLNANLHSADVRERFAREARALALLSHSNIVNIYDSGEFQNSPFIVMEYVRGETLAEKIKRRAPMSLAQKLKLMAELCAGLACAHEAGVVHRDIKPANLMVDQQGRLRILDFGIARVAEGAMTRAAYAMTQVNMRIGTPGYMSPEQIEGGEVDARSDIFAVGTVFYELLSYREAFSGNSTRQIEDKVLQAQPTPLVSLIPGLNSAIAEIVSRALEKDPSKRYQDAGTLEQELEHQRWRLGPAETPSPSRPTPQPGVRRQQEPRGEAVYQRAHAVFEEGALETARRFAIEALAEDPNHLGARALLEQLDPQAWISSTPQMEWSPKPVPPTELASQAYEPTVLRASGDSRPPSGRKRHPDSEKRRSPIWNKYWRAIAIGAIAVAAAVVALMVIRVGGWFASRPMLTITKPTGGTILADGITCGTLGTDCSDSRANGETVELRAQPDQNFVLSSYTGDCAPSGRMIMTGPRTCGATFVPISNGHSPLQRVLTITSPKGGTIVSDTGGITCGTLGTECQASRPDGTKVKLDVLVDQGFAFARYTGACAPDGETVLTEARTCGATFVPSQIAAVRPPPPPPSTSKDSSGSRPNRTAPQADVVLPPSAKEESDSGSPVATAGPSPGPSLGPSPGASPGPLPGPSVGPVGRADFPTPPPITPEEFAKNEIQRVLKEYCLAYSDMDIVAIRRVYPTAAASFKDQFRQFKSVECTLTGPPEFQRLDPAAGTASLDVGVKMVFDNKIGGSQPPQNTVARVTLSRPEPRGSWHIDSLLHKPKK